MTRGERWLVGAVVVLAVSVLATGGLVVCLSLGRREGGDSGADGSASRLAAGPPIAFVSDRDDERAIYITAADGSDVRRVAGPEALYVPFWLPDGQRLTYLARQTDSETRFAIHVVPVDEAGGAGDEVVGSFDVEGGRIWELAWSPDATVLAVAVEEEVPERTARQSTLYFVGVGAGDAVVERTLAVPGDIFSLQWSPSGDVLLIVGSRYGPRYDPAAYQVSLLAEGGAELVVVWHGAAAADWSPDGEEIVVGDWEASRVLILGRDGTPRRAFELQGRPRSVDWSPDGARIAVLAADPEWESSWVGNALHVVTVESGELITVVEPAEGWVHSLSWSPDSVGLTFTRGMLGSRPGAPINAYADLWVYDCMSGQAYPVLAGEAYEGMGVWSP